MSRAAAGAIVGQAVLRLEDERILVGGGSYIDDIDIPGTLHAAFVRSQAPHARILSVNTEAAKAMPGVVGVFTGEDIQKHTQALQFPSERPGLQRPLTWALAVGKVLFVGDPIAVVVADTRARAEDGCDAVEVDYDWLTPVATVEQAQDPERGFVYDELGTNLMHEDDQVFGDPDAAFAQADRVVHHQMRQQRVTHVPIETRGLIADYRPHTNDFTIYASCQGQHKVRHELAQLLRHPLDRMRVIAPDVGGSFGQKAMPTREDVVVTMAAKLLERPVKWIEDRVENLTAAPQAREETVEVRAAVRNDGTILGLDVSLVLDQGSYSLRSFAAGLIPAIVRTMYPGPYGIGAMRWHSEVWATNKPPYGVYRGPWASEALSRETLIDRIAEELGLEPMEVRQRNVVPLDAQPTKMVTGPTLEGLTNQETLSRIEEIVDIPAFRVMQREARREGRLLGLGISTFMEAAPGPPDYSTAIGFAGMAPEQAIAQLEADGRLTVFSAQVPHGQGHATTLAQVAADAFGMPMENVHVVFGDTTTTPFHPIGTGGSRAAALGSGSVIRATQAVRDSVLQAASEMLEIAPEDLEITDGKVAPVGATEMGVALTALAAKSYYAPKPGSEAGFRAARGFGGPGRGGWGLATHACFVEVDPGTGTVDIWRYVVCEDCGTIINPGIVEGQVRGGITQGIGQVLLEHAAYDEDGNPLASTFLDYLVPTATEIPNFELHHLESEPMDEVNFRGVGEGGTINAAPAVVNAVADAVGRQPITELPMTPERVLALVDSMAPDEA